MQTEQSDFESRMANMQAIAILQKEISDLKAKNIELTGKLSAVNLGIKNVSDAMGLSGDGPFSLQVITKFTDLQADNETLRAMVQELTAQRDARDSMLNDLNASIRREQAEREKNAKLLARIGQLEGEKSQATFQPVAARDVLKERLRQINQEGWTPKHDDEHNSGEIAGAAACYAAHANARGWVYVEDDPTSYQSERAPEGWPWDSMWWKPVSPRRDLVRAGALILAEIDRIDRASHADKGGN